MIQGMLHMVHIPHMSHIILHMMKDDVFINRLLSESSAAFRSIHSNQICLLDVVYIKRNIMSISFYKKIEVTGFEPAASTSLT